MCLRTFLGSLVYLCSWYSQHREFVIVIHYSHTTITTPAQLYWTTYHTTKHHTQRHNITAHNNTTRHNTTAHNTTRRQTTPRHTTPHHTIPRHHTPLHVTPHNTTPQHATPHHVTPHHGILVELNVTKLNNHPLPSARLFVREQSLDLFPYLNNYSTPKCALIVRPATKSFLGQFTNFILTWHKRKMCV